MEKDQVKNIMPNAEIAKDLAVNKAIDLVKTKAIVTEEKPGKTEKKADKKQAAPKAEKAEKKPAKQKAEKPAEPNAE